MTTDQIKNAPEEVIKVWLYQQSNITIGSSLFKTISDIIDKYPEYFPWEHKYMSIPESVHDAFEKEKSYYLWSLEQKKWELNERGSYYLYADLAKEIKLEDVFQRLSEQQEKMKKERREKYIAIKAIWDKHYKQYELEYKGH